MKADRATAASHTAGPSEDPRTVFNTRLNHSKRSLNTTCCQSSNRTFNRNNLSTRKRPPPPPATLPPRQQGRPFCTAQDHGQRWPPGDTGARQEEGRPAHVLTAHLVLKISVWKLSNTMNRYDLTHSDTLNTSETTASAKGQIPTRKPPPAPLKSHPHPLQPRICFCHHT